MQVTANHAMQVLQPQAKEFLPLPAGDVHSGDRLHTYNGRYATVESCDVQVLNTECFEVVFEDPASTVYVGAPDSPLNAFVEVYGELAPPRNDGQAVAFGDQDSGWCAAPPLPARPLPFTPPR